MLRFFAALFFSTAGYTTFMSAMAWESLRLSHRAGSPALIFAISSMVSLALGPYLGVLVDHLGPYRSFRMSQVASVTVLAACVPFARPLLGSEYGLLLLAGAYGGANAMCHPSMQAILQQHATGETAITIASKSGVVVAMGFVLGYSLGGSAVDFGGLASALGGCGVAALTSALCIPRQAPRPASGQGKRRRNSTGRQLIDGARYLVSQPALRDAAVAYVLCYSIFHLVTALLPPFSKFVLQVEGAEFGFLRASWSGGSAAGSLLLSAFWGSRQLAVATRFLFVAALGVGLAVFSQVNSYPVALLVIGTVGCAHSFCRAFLDGLLLQITDPQFIGRVRSNINSLLSGVSLLVFTVSAFLEATALRWALAFTGIAVTVACLGYYGRSRALGRTSARVARTEAAVAAAPQD
jgi:hypothetical protein